MRLYPQDVDGGADGDESKTRKSGLEFKDEMTGNVQRRARDWERATKGKTGRFADAQNEYVGDEKESELKPVNQRKSKKGQKSANTETQETETEHQWRAEMKATEEYDHTAPGPLNDEPVDIDSLIDAMEQVHVDYVHCSDI